MKKKTLIYIAYALWVIGGVTLKILGLIGWGAALSWLWLPFGSLLCALVFINGAVDIGKNLKKKEQSKIPDDCEHCLFGVTSKYDKDGKCLGETLDETVKKGEKICPYFKKSTR